MSFWEGILAFTPLVFGMLVYTGWVVWAVDGCCPDYYGVNTDGK